jgi:hypothetical protein
MEVYDLIEQAIESGKKSITVELDGESKKITWTVTGSDWQCFDRLSGETFEVCGDDEHSVRSAVETYLQDGIDTDTGEVDYDVVATAYDGRSYNLSGTVSPVDEDEDDSEDVLVGATKFALTNSETGEQCEHTANDLWTAQMLAAEDHGGEPGDWTDGDVADQPKSRQVTYDFMGSVSNDKTEAANAVVAALESIQPDDPNEMTDDVIDAAVEFLGGEWDRESLVAALDGCCFSYVE